MQCSHNTLWFEFALIFSGLESLTVFAVTMQSLLLSLLSPPTQIAENNTHCQQVVLSNSGKKSVTEAEDGEACGDKGQQHLIRK